MFFFQKGLRLRYLLEMTRFSFVLQFALIFRILPESLSAFVASDISCRSLPHAHDGLGQEGDHFGHQAGFWGSSLRKQRVRFSKNICVGRWLGLWGNPLTQLNYAFAAEEIP